ncbi:probable mixed-linked glucan synthase 9 [Triticum urartu]|uniref:probable mixed-linked glucan synthase 9 n=1 Tax=Triticum urartu TaxID=4572 RepID=UPI002042F3FB|nr:probable mixed-linked glucan synthase 9 [Triticum urartu]
MASPAAVRGGRLADPLLAADVVVGAKDRYWVPADEREILASQKSGAGEDGRVPLLYRTFMVNGFLINLYRWEHRLGSVPSSPLFCAIDVCSRRAVPLDRTLTFHR